MSRLWTREYILIWIVTAAQTSAWALYLHLPGFLQDLGASEVGIGSFIGASVIVAIAVRPWAGSLMDRRGRRPVLLSGGVMAVLASLLYLTVSSIGLWLVIVRIFHGLAEGFLFAVVYVYGADIVPADRRSEGLAIFGLAGLLPWGLAGILGDWLLASFTYNAVFLVAAAFSLLALVVATFLPELKPLSLEPPAPTGSWVAAVMQRRLVPLFWMTFLYAISVAGVSTFLKTYVGELGFGSVGAYFGAMALSATVVRLSFLRFAQLREKWILLPAFTIFALSLVLLAEARSSSYVLVSGLLAGVADGLAFPVIFALVVSRASLASRGIVVAVFIAMFDLGTLAGSPGLGGVIAAVGYRTMYLLSAALAAVGVAIFWIWDRWATRGAAPPSAEDLEVVVEAPPHGAAI